MSSGSVKVVGLTLELWDQYRELYRARSYPIPPQPVDGIWVVDSAGVPIGGLCIYAPAGPYALFEHAILNPAMPLRLRAKAFEVGLEAARTYCATRGVVPRCTVTSLGMKRFMQRRGWHAQAAIPMYLWPLELERK